MPHEPAPSHGEFEMGATAIPALLAGASVLRAIVLWVLLVLMSMAINNVRSSA